MNFANRQISLLCIALHFRKHDESSCFLNVDPRRNCYKPFGKLGKPFRKHEVSCEKKFDTLDWPAIVDEMKTPTTQEAKDLILWLYSMDVQHDETPAMARRRYEAVCALKLWAGYDAEKPLDNQPTNL